MSSTHWLDTNVLLRFLLNDHPEMSPAAATLIQQAGSIRFKVAAVVLAECCYVLRGKIYSFNHSDIACVLKDFLLVEGIESDELPILLNALHLFEKHRLDFADAYLMARAQTGGGESIVSFDSDILRLYSPSFDPMKATPLGP